MTDDGFGVGMLIVSIGKNSTISQQIAKSAVVEMVQAASRQICSQSIDGDLQDEANLTVCVSCGTGARAENYCRRNAVEQAD